MALLGGVANGVEGQEVLIELDGAEALQHGALEQAANLFGFALQHGGLVGDAHPDQIAVGVEAGRAGFSEAVHEGLPIAVAEDVFAHHLGFGQVEHHQVGAGEAAGGEGFLVLHLAVNDRGEGVLFVLFHRVPHLGDPGAGGINDVAAPLAQQLHLLHGGAEGGQDHHITAGNLRKIFHAVFHGDEQHVHVAQVIVDRRVVDDFVGDPDPFSGVVAPGFVGHRHRPLYAPAEPKSFRQPHGEAAALERVAAFPQLGDQIALVGLLQASCHLIAQTEASAVVTLRVVQGAFEGAGIHSVEVSVNQLYGPLRSELRLPGSSDGGPQFPASPDRPPAPGQIPPPAIRPDAQASR